MGQTGAFPTNGFDSKDVRSLYVGRSGTLYATRGQSGLWKTDDLGKTWLQMYLGIADDAVGSIAEIGKDTLLLQDLYNGEILRSQDGGKTWKWLALHASQFIGELVGNLNQHEVLTAAQNGPLLSLDYGNTWLQLGINANQGIPNFRIFPDGSLAAGNIAGLFASSDFGSTWIHIDSSFSDHGTLISTGSDKICYTLTSSSLLATMDSGKSWSTMTANQIPSATTLFSASDGTLLAGDDFDLLYSSTDSGHHLFLDTVGLSGEPVSSIIETKDGRILLVGKSSDLFISDGSISAPGQLLDPNTFTLKESIRTRRSPQLPYRSHRAHHTTLPFDW